MYDRARGTLSNTKTRALAETDALEILWFVMPVGKEVAEHQAPLEITLQ